MTRTQKIILYGMGWMVDIVLYIVGVIQGSTNGLAPAILLVASAGLSLSLIYFSGWFFRSTFRDTFGFKSSFRNYYGPFRGDVREREQRMVDLELSRWAKRLESAYDNETQILENEPALPDIPKSQWNGKVKTIYKERKAVREAARKEIEKAGRNGYWLRHRLAKEAGYSVPEKCKDSIGN